MQKLLFTFLISLPCTTLFSQAVSIVNSNNTDTALSVHNNGTGPVSSFITNNTDNTGALVYGDHYGKGSGIRMRLMNSQNNNAGIYIFNSGNGSGILSSSNKSKSGEFYSNAGNADTTVYIKHDGTGTGLSVDLNNATTLSSAADLRSKGLGSGLTVRITNQANFYQAIYVETLGTGTGMFASSLGGHGVWGITSSISSAGVIGDNTYGEAVVGRNRGGVGAGAVVGRNDSTGPGVRGFGSGNGIGVLGQAGFAGGNGNAGMFENLNTSNQNDVLIAKTNGTGTVLNINATSQTGPQNVLKVNTNGNGNLALFQRDDINIVRIDNNGKGYFNGGMQSSGADVAEAFAVEDKRTNYEPGDVLAISRNANRTITKSSAPYSTLVIGVYATKPGVLLTEEQLDTDLSSKVPLGVIGVVPTKVCLEGGPIQRGDLLVTSSIPGVAMKADIEKLKPGQVIGKALEPFNGTGVQKINLMVNIK